MVLGGLSEAFAHDGEQPSSMDRVGVVMDVQPGVSDFDVDLVAVAGSAFTALSVNQTVSTILSVFQQPRRCAPLNEALPPGASPLEEGL